MVRAGNPEQRVIVVLGWLDELRERRALRRESEHGRRACSVPDFVSERVTDRSRRTNAGWPDRSNTPRMQQLPKRGRRPPARGSASGRYRACQHGAQRHDRWSDERQLDAIDRDIVPAVEIDQLVAAARQHVDRRDAAQSAHVRPALARRRGARSRDDYGLARSDDDHLIAGEFAGRGRNKASVETERLRPEGRKGDHSVERELGERPRSAEARIEPANLRVGATAGPDPAGLVLQSRADERGADGAAIDWRIRTQHVLTIVPSLEAPGPPMAKLSGRTLSARSQRAPMYGVSVEALHSHACESDASARVARKWFRLSSPEVSVARLLRRSDQIHPSFVNVERCTPRRRVVGRSSDNSAPNAGSIRPSCDRYVTRGSTRSRVPGTAISGANGIRQPVSAVVCGNPKP